MPSTISAGTTAGTAIAIAGDTTGNLAFQTNGTTTAMTINTSQNVGVGTTNPSATNFSKMIQVAGAAAVGLSATSSSGPNGEFGALGGSVYVAATNAYPLIFGTDNTERMRIDSSGRVTMPFQPAFFALKNGSSGNQLANTASASPTIVDWDTTLVNTGSCFNASTNRFTAPVAGRYMFVVTVSWYLPSGNERWAAINFLKNGSNVGTNYLGMTNLSTSAFGGSSTYANSSGNIMLTLAANDYIQVGAFCASGISYVWDDGTYFSGYLIG